MKGAPHLPRESLRLASYLQAFFRTPAIFWPPSRRTTEPPSHLAAEPPSHRATEHVRGIMLALNTGVR